MDIDEAQRRVTQVEQAVESALRVLDGEIGAIGRAVQKSYEPWDNAKDQGRQAREQLNLTVDLLKAAHATLTKTGQKMRGATQHAEELAAQRRVRSAGAARI